MSLFCPTKLKARNTEVLCKESLQLLHVKRDLIDKPFDPNKELRSLALKKEENIRKEIAYGLVISPSRAKHISKHLCKDELYNQSVEKIVGNIMESLLNRDGSTHIFYGERFDGEKKRYIDSVVVISENPKSKILMVVNPDNNEIATVYPCSDTSFETYRRLASQVEVDIRPGSEKVFNLINSKFDKVKTKFGLIFEKGDICAFNSSGYRISRGNRLVRGNTIEKEFNSKVDLVKLTDEIIFSLINEDKNAIVNFENDDLLFDQITIGYKSKDIISTTGDVHVILKVNPNNNVVETLMPCSEKCFNEILEEYDKTKEINDGALKISPGKEQIFKLIDKQNSKNSALKFFI